MLNNLKAIFYCYVKRDCSGCPYEGLSTDKCFHLLDFIGEKISFNNIIKIIRGVFK